jgi:hypothetical protein
MSRSYTSCPPSASLTCSGTALLYFTRSFKDVNSFTELSYVYTNLCPSNIEIFEDYSLTGRYSLATQIPFL